MIHNKREKEQAAHGRKRAIKQRQERPPSEEFDYDRALRKMRAMLSEIHREPQKEGT